MTEKISTNFHASYLQRLVLHTPINTSWEPSIAQQCMVGLFAVEQPLCLQIRAHSNTITWCVDVPYQLVSTLENHFYSLYPAAQVIQVSKTQADTDYFVYELQTVAPFVGPLHYATDFSTHDPLAGILTVMSHLQEGETCVLSLMLNPPTKNYSRIGANMITESRHKWWHFLTPQMAVETLMWQSMMGIERRIPKYEADIQREAEHKLRMPLKEVNFIFKVQSKSQRRADELLMQLSAPLAMYGRDGLNAFVPSNQNSYQLILSALEVAALWHLPNEACTVPGITWVTDKHIPPPIELSQGTQGIALGKSFYHGRQVEVGIADADRVTHINIIGSTRTGKSTLLHNMIHQDILAGKGVGVIDPHGDLAEDILKYSIPKHREDDVVLFDLLESEKVIGLNPLCIPQQIDIATAATQTLSVFRRLFGDTWIDGRMEDTVYACLVSLMSVEGSVIMDIPRLLLDEVFRQRVVDQVTDFAVREFWDLEFGQSQKSARMDLAKPVNTRIRKLYRDRTPRRIVGQQDSLNFDDILSSGKIFLANMRGTTTLEGNTIGALLITKFQMAAMSRSRQERRNRLMFYLYIDEVQNFVGTSLPEIFSEAAKFGLSLVSANQYLGQLNPDTVKSVLGNVGTNIMFRSGKDETEAFSSLIEPNYSKDDLRNLSRFKAIIKTQHQGTTLPAFLVHTNPPPQPVQSSADVVTRITEKSRQKYGKPVAEIDAELAKRYQADTGDRISIQDKKQERTSPDDSKIRGNQFYG